MVTEDIDKRLKLLERRLMDLELEADNGLLSALISIVGKSVNSDLFTCVEKSVAKYFGIDHRLFYGNIIPVGNRRGRRGKSIPVCPSTLDNEEEKLAAARIILYGIIHVDFGVSIPDMSQFYSVNVKNYMREWKLRYIRIFHSSDPPAKNDDIYKKYWCDCHAAVVRSCQENGILDQLYQKLESFDIDNKISYIYVNKWRLYEED